MAFDEDNRIYSGGVTLSMSKIPSY
ncbi:hypothetical protein [Paenibacillus faecalis]